MSEKKIIRWWRVYIEGIRGLPTNFQLTKLLKFYRLKSDYKAVGIIPVREHL